MIPYFLPDWLKELPAINTRLSKPIQVYQVEATFRALETIHKFPGNKYTHASLAKVAGINDRTLRLVFKEFTGITIAQYIRQLRLQEGRAALNRGENVDMVSLMLGYNDIRHFRQLLKAK